MRPGPSAPYHTRGIRMMGPGPTRQGYSPFGGSFMGPSHPRMNPMMGARQPARQGGGILARLLGKGQGAGANFPSFGGAVQGVQRAAGGGGLLNSLSNPATINGFLTNTQKVLQTAQQVGPMVQQYGPLVKNLPALWRLYKGFKDLPDQEQDGEDVETIKDERKSGSNSNKNTSSAPTTKRNKTTTEETTSRPKSVTRNSTPKLFI